MAEIDKPNSIDDLLQKYHMILKDVDDRLLNVRGELEAEQVRRLHREVSRHAVRLQQVLLAMKRAPSPDIGDEIEVVRQRYTADGSPYEEYRDEGQIIRMDRDRGTIEVRIPEMLCPERIVRAAWNVYSSEWVIQATWIEEDSEWNEHMEDGLDNTD